MQVQGPKHLSVLRCSPRLVEGKLKLTAVWDIRITSSGLTHFATTPGPSFTFNPNMFSYWILIEL